MSGMNIANGQYQKKARRRTKFLALVLGLWSLGIAARLFQLQVLGHAQSKAQVIEQNQKTDWIIPERGTIYDRNGQILALSVPARSIFYKPSPSESPEIQLRSLLKLKPLLDWSGAEIERIRAALVEGKTYIPLRRKADPETAQKIKALGLAGVNSDEEMLRLYPQGKLAAQVLGGVDMANKGVAGIELKYESALKGTRGEQFVLIDNKSRKYDFETVLEPQSGKDLELTLDSTIQYFAETALNKAMADQEAAWGTVIVSNPLTGEILAMASAPDYDPNAGLPADPEAGVNRAIRHLYEPGSTFKIVTASAALENRCVSLTQNFDCSKGLIEAAGGAIRDHKIFGTLTFPEVIIESSNVGTIQVGRQVGPPLLSQTIQAFRFGEKTGIELPAESAGIVHPLAEWTKRSLDSVSIGYELSATALQILQAANVIANRGMLVPPRIVKSIAGVPVKRRPAGGEQVRVLSEQTAQALAAILERVVLEGTGKEAAAGAFAVAGKTGTTQIFDTARKTYQSSKHIASFVGFVPVDRPALSIIVVLAEPKKDAYYGGLVAAPVFREIALRTLRYKGIIPPAGADRTILAARSAKGKRP
jgi:cell division protein FtsI (penicillin-binding protein 3)